MGIKADILNCLEKSVERLSDRIDKKTTSHSENICKDLNQLQIVKSILGNHEQLLKPENGSDMQLFFQMKETKSLVCQYDTTFSKIEQNIGKETLVVRFQPTLKAFFEQDECIGTIIGERHPL